MEIVNLVMNTLTLLKFFVGVELRHESKDFKAGRSDRMHLLFLHQ